MCDDIRYGWQNANDAKNRAAAKHAAAHKFIVDLAELNGNAGYDAQVGEREVKLSGASVSG